MLACVRLSGGELDSPAVPRPLFNPQTGPHTATIAFAPMSWLRIRLNFRRSSGLVM
jgi:hypothetical protein